MLLNATLLRVDPSEAGPAGPAISFRCALTRPTLRQARWLRSMRLQATAAIYLPVQSPAPPTLGVGMRLRVQVDEDAAGLWKVLNVQVTATGVLPFRLAYLKVSI